MIDELMLVWILSIRWNSTDPVISLLDPKVIASIRVMITFILQVYMISTSLLIGLCEVTPVIFIDYWAPCKSIWDLKGYVSLNAKH